MSSIVSYAFFFGLSPCNALIKEMIMSNMMKENGKAAIMIVFCNAVSPFTDSKMTAMADWMTPHVIFTLFDGVNEPYVDCMPNTNVAESADVMKKHAINRTAKRETIKSSTSWRNFVIRNLSINLIFWVHQ